MSTEIEVVATTDDQPQVMRDERGRLLPGSNLNPNGVGALVRRERADRAMQRAVEREWTPESIIELADEAEQLARSVKSWKGLLEIAKFRMAYIMGTPVARSINMSVDADERLRQWLAEAEDSPYTARADTTPVEEP
jgi:hypothetical protein